MPHTSFVLGLLQCVCVKLNKIKRWLVVKELIQEGNGIVVHFSSTHRDYYTAWNYVRKEGDYIESEGHPDLVSAGVQRTTTALEVRRRGREERIMDQGRKRCKLTNLMISDTILQNNIKNLRELHALANTQKINGKTDLTSFILDRGAKKISELIDTTWDMENAASKLKREKLSRIDICRSFLQRTCIENYCSHKNFGK